MTESISDELRRTYELATMRHAAERLQTGRQWQEARDIMDRYGQARADLRKAYGAEFPARMAEARQKLIHEAASRAPDLTHPDAPQDRFSNTAIDHKAKRMVRSEHQLDMAVLDRAEAKDLAELMQRADRANQVRGKARQSFEKQAAQNPTRSNQKQRSQPRARQR